MGAVSPGALRAHTEALLAPAGMRRSWWASPAPHTPSVIAPPSLDVARPQPPRLRYGSLRRRVSISKRLSDLHIREELKMHLKEVGRDERRALI